MTHYHMSLDNFTGTITVELTIIANYKEVNVIVIGRFGHAATFYRALYLTCELSDYTEI